MIYNKVVCNLIEREKKGEDYVYSEFDKTNLKNMISEINKYCQTHFAYLAELDASFVPGAGNIIKKYFMGFDSESVRAYLIPQLVLDKVPDCENMIFQSYIHFKNSEVYISASGKPAPAHIYSRYDTAFRKLKPKKIKLDLLNLIENPRDAFYLPLTVQMLAKWRMPELESILISFIDNNWITASKLGIADGDLLFYPSIEFIKRELIFASLEGLRYYHSDETYETIKSLESGSDSDIALVAKKTLNAIKKY